MLLSGIRNVSSEKDVDILNFFPLLDVGKRAGVLISHGATNTLFQVLVAESRSQPVNEDLLLLFHQVLSKLGPKGKCCD